MVYNGMESPLPRRVKEKNRLFSTLSIFRRCWLVTSSLLRYAIGLRKKMISPRTRGISIVMPGERPFTRERKIRDTQHKLSVREYQGYYLAFSVAPRVAK